MTHQAKIEVSRRVLSSKLFTLKLIPPCLTVSELTSNFDFAGTPEAYQTAFLGQPSFRLKFLNDSESE